MLFRSADYDNDGDLDLYVTHGNVSNALYSNDGDATFTEVGTTENVLGTSTDGRAAAWADYDNDGDLDILVANLDARPNLLRNDSQPRGNWLSLRLRSKGFNREGIGARIYVQTDSTLQMREVRTGTSFQSQNDLRQHFGLGHHERADLRIRWPDGSEQEFAAVEANDFYTIDRENATINAE